VGHPESKSPVLVTANFKLSFDRLRSELEGLDVWILVLDTRGINVWCAAGKGTFGTAELINRIKMTGLEKLVSHHTIVLPQLGATGVSAHVVKQESGFRVDYGPVHARDLRAFLSSGMKATPEMRRVEFPLKDRWALIPVELVLSLKYGLPIAAGLVIVSGFGSDGYDVARLGIAAATHGALMLGAILVGTVILPLLLPWLPGRPFAVKGAFLGFLYAILIAGIGFQHPDVFRNTASWAAWLLLAPAITSYLGMNFSGCSTYTSLSGVLLEIRVAAPIQIGFASIGLVVWTTALFLTG
jgi:acetyl-CoA decarbonylase/synthase complex subunit gamma